MENLSKRQLAEGFFKQGYNCSQAVVLAFENEIGLDRQVLLNMASSFGGGMGRLRLTCGAVSGMFLVLGLITKRDMTDIEQKRTHYAQIQKLARIATERLGSISCAKLLNSTDTSPNPTLRSDDFYEKRPCLKIIGECAEILQEELNGKSY